MYVFKRFEDDNAFFRLFQCKHGDSCHKLISNPSKFMDHMRSHTKDRPYKCTYDGCVKAFTQKTNLK